MSNVQYGSNKTHLSVEKDCMIQSLGCLIEKVTHYYRAFLQESSG